MTTIYCFHNCPSAVCISSCPAGALAARDNKVVVESNRCYGCGICQHMCMTWTFLWRTRTEAGWLIVKEN